jgi:hypothetical protein
MLFDIGVIFLIISSYRFVDCIIKAAIASTPHTTPQSRFPATKMLWQQEVESTIFPNAPRKLEDSLRAPVKGIYG